MMIWKMAVEADLEADDWQSMWKWQRMQPVKVGFDNQYLVVVGNDVVDGDREGQGWMGSAILVQQLFYFKTYSLVIRSFIS